MEGSFSGAGDILLAADGTSAITLSGVAVNQTGDIVNSGAGTATVTIRPRLEKTSERLNKTAPHQCSF